VPLNIRYKALDRMALNVLTKKESHALEYKDFFKGALSFRENALEYVNRKKSHERTHL